MEPGQQGRARRVEVIGVPVKTMSTLNLREHWAQRARRAKTHRNAAFALARSRAATMKLPVTVTLTRIAPSNGLDDDNLRGALKSVRDGIADAFRLDDRDPRIVWRYDQQRGKPYSVKVEMIEIVEVIE